MQAKGRREERLASLMVLRHLLGGFFGLRVFGVKGLGFWGLGFWGLGFRVPFKGIYRGYYKGIII